MRTKAKIGFLLAVVLTVSTAGQVCASSEGGNSVEVGGLTCTAEADGSYTITGDEDLVNGALDDASRESLVGSLPGAYTTPKLTLVSSQGNTNLCWAYAGLDSAQIGLLNNGTISQNAQLFSPGHLAYSTFHGEGDSWAPVTGSWWSYGGNTMMASSTLLRWYGAASESDFPTTQGLQITATGLKTSESHLINYMRLPEVNAQTKDKTSGEYSYDLNTDSADWRAAINAIKQAVMDYHSITVDILYEGIDSETKSLYSENLQNLKNKPDHQVVVVGWDDAKITKASRPGAFLIKNTWNSNWGDKGYGWLSYYDRTYVYPTVYELEPSVSGNHLDKDIYYYDGAGYNNWMFDRKDKLKISSANVFTAKRDELLDAVGIYLPANASYTIKVRTGLTDGTPNTGVVAETVTGTKKYFGFYTIPLNRVLRIAKGERFAVEVSSCDGDGIYYCYYEGNSTSQRSLTSARGQSFYAYGTNAYKDVKDYPAETLNNACIKAYGNPDVGQTIFLDVSREKYYYQPIEWARTSGVVSGTSNRSFSPDQGCTRGQIVTMLYGVMKDNELMALNTLAVNPFQDIESEKYYFQPVMWAAGNKITSGTKPGFFAPGASCTRAQAVSFLYRLAGSPDVSTEDSPFTDVSPSAYYAKAVAWALQNHITGGTSQTTFSPSSDVTRGQMVTFLYHTYGK